MPAKNRHEGLRKRTCSKIAFRSGYASHDVCKVLKAQGPMVRNEGPLTALCSVPGCHGARDEKGNFGLTPDLRVAWPGDRSTDRTAWAHFRSHAV